MCVGGSSSLSSAEASLYRTEGWREGKRNRAGVNGKGKKPSSSLLRKSGAILNALYGRGSPIFPYSYRPPRVFYFSIIAIFIGIPSGSLCGGERIFVKCPVLVACEHAIHLGESREVTRDPHASVRRDIPRLAWLAWRACSLAKFKRRSLHATKLNGKSRKVGPM